MSSLRKHEKVVSWVPGLEGGEKNRHKSPTPCWEPYTEAGISSLSFEAIVPQTHHSLSFPLLPPHLHVARLLIIYSLSSLDILPVLFSPNCSFIQ